MRLTISDLLKNKLFIRDGNLYELFSVHYKGGLTVELHCGWYDKPFDDIYWSCYIKKCLEIPVADFINLVFYDNFEEALIVLKSDT